MIQEDWVLRMRCVIFPSSLFPQGFSVFIWLPETSSITFLFFLFFVFVLLIFLSNLRVLLPHKMWNNNCENLFICLSLWNKLHHNYRECALSYLDIPQIKSCTLPSQQILSPTPPPRLRRLFVFLPFCQKLTCFELLFYSGRVSIFLYPQKMFPAHMLALCIAFSVHKKTSMFFFVPYAFNRNKSVQENIINFLLCSCLQPVLLPQDRSALSLINQKSSNDV